MIIVSFYENKFPLCYNDNLSQLLSCVCYFVLKPVLREDLYVSLFLDINTFLEISTYFPSDFVHVKMLDSS